MHFLFHIDEQNTEPLYKQICDSIKTAILEGRLKQGDKLPSSRTLSDTLGVSRVTASRSLDELASQGYIKLSAAPNGRHMEAQPDLASRRIFWFFWPRKFNRIESRMSGGRQHSR